uniref:Enkurin n=2 Tax=Cacopsylla melanoneura TaxID=428564 RepID=A0A8D9BG76_9HEMI
MTPVYVFGENFGKTPKYIIRRKYQLEQYQQKAEKPDEQPLPFLPISAQERLEILQGLKNYWSEVEREFRSLPLKIDTEPLKKRKSALEAKFKSLEKDIELLERHENIYVMKE